MYGSLEDINRSRESMRRRIEWLNKKNAKTVAELGKYLKEQVALGKKLMRDDVIAAILKCFANLVRRTPVDTGRLRAGWQFTGDVSNIEFMPGTSKSEIKRALNNSIRNSVFGETDALYVFNNVEYLLALNAGWSKRQAGHFIDKFLQELKGELQKAASRQAA